jgi:hypothetical protein
MKREVRSFWYPTWLAQPAALVEGSKLIDAPPHDLSFEDIVPEVKNRDLVVMHTSTPSFKSDIKTAEMIKAINPDVKIGFIGAKVAVEPEKSLISGRAVDFVARNEFDFTIKEVADGVSWSNIKGLSYRNAEGVIVHNEDRAVLENMDSLPWVTPVYKRDLNVEKYFGGYLKHLVLHRSRLQIALHLLPLAADGRWSSLPRALGRKCGGRNEMGEGRLPASEGILFRR